MLTPRQKVSIAVIAVSGLALSGLIVWGVNAAALTAHAPSAPPFAVATTLPGLAAPTGEPQLASIARLHPIAGAVVPAAGPFDDRFVLQDLRFDGTQVSGTVDVTSDVSEVLELQVLAGFYDTNGALLGTDRFVHHLTDDGSTDPTTGTPQEHTVFSIAVPAELAGRAVSVSLGVPVLVNE